MHQPTADMCLNRAIMVPNEVCFAAPVYTVNYIHQRCGEEGLENADRYILLHTPPPRPQCHPLQLPSECRGVNS